MNLPDAARRAIRTFVQAWTGTFLTLWIGPAVMAGEIPDRDFMTRVVVASTVAGAVALVTWLHNWSEDKGAIPAIGKAPPSPGATASRSMPAGSSFTSTAIAEPRSMRLAMTARPE